MTSTASEISWLIFKLELMISSWSWLVFKKES